MCVSTVAPVAAVLVTGGTGLLGKRLVPELVERGHRVRVLARHVDGIGGDVEPVEGDVRSPERVGDAMRGMDIVVHAATNVRRGMRATEIEGTRNVVDAVERHGGHLIYVSIVGVDRHRFPYYEAKWAAEQVVESSRCSWTIQRATQFLSWTNKSKRDYEEEEAAENFNRNSITRQILGVILSPKIDLLRR